MRFDPKLRKPHPPQESLELIPNFSPKFEDLQRSYGGFQARFEFRRRSFRDFFAHLLQQVTLTNLKAELAKNDPTALEIKEGLRQRHFYKSATCFYRSLDLFLAYVSLRNHMFRTWAEVTGYYSRFYFIQALLNLLQANWFDGEEGVFTANLIDKKDARFFAYNTGLNIDFLAKPDLLKLVAAGERTGSHQVWWQIYGALDGLRDYPQFEALEFVLSDGYFNPGQRNAVNYSHEYIQGFPELEWFDAAENSMLSHFGFQWGHGDRDITDIGRFFGDRNPEECDPGDFYGDEVQMLWCSIECYLRLLAALKIDQNFITPGKITALSEAHLREEFPNLRNGIKISVGEILGN